MTILIATGLQREAAILARSGVVVVAGGGDAARLERELEAAAPGARMILSCGLAGALDPALKGGDIVLADLFPGEGRGPVGGPAQLDPGLRRGSNLVDVLRQHLPDAHLGTGIGSDTIIATVVEKRTLYAKTNALAVDMESHIAARVAARHNLPFAIIRAISDDASHALPPAALVGMRPDGAMALGAVLASLARNPAQLPALIRTGIHAGRAFSELRRVGDVLGSLGVGLADDLQLPLDMR
ncbi:MAG: phosphorylase [Sphingomonas bacterium]